MDHPSNSVEEAAKSVNPGDQGLSTSYSSESNALAEPNEAFAKDISGHGSGIGKIDSYEAPIDMVRRHGVEEFHGTNMEESDKAEFLLEKLQIILEKVRCSPDQKVSCVVSPL